MNKIEFSKLKNKENKQIAFNQLKDDYKTLYKEKDKLESNWKALKECLEEQLMYFKENNEQGGFSDNVEDLEIVLDKMDELEGDKE